MQPDLCIYWTTDAEPEPDVEPPQPPPRPKQTVCWDDAAGFVRILLAMTTEPEPEVEPPQPPLSTTTNNFVSVPWQQHLSKTLPYRCGLPPPYIYIFFFFSPPSVAQV